MPLFTPPNVRATDANNALLSGAKWHFYQSGTTTYQTVYADAGRTTPLANPVASDAGGKFPAVYLDPTLNYRAMLKTAVGATVSGYDFDPIEPAASASDLAVSTGSSLVGFVQSGVGAVARTVQAKLFEIPLTPEDFGATGYASAAAAAIGVDSTAAIQAMADAGGANRLRVTGNGRWYKVGTVSWPSGTRCSDLRLYARSSTVDVQPFLIDGRASAKSDLVFSDIEVDGNRVGQTNLTTSGGDGQRHGIAIQGRVSNVTLVRPKVWNCATDGIWIYHDGASLTAPASVNDLFFSNIRIIDPDLQWNGRHGGSAESINGLLIRGGLMKNNGKNAAGYPSGAYTDGGNGRTSTGTYGGPLYGRAWDCESYLLGTRYKNVTFDGVDCRANAGGSILFYHRYHTGVGDTCDMLRVSNCELDDLNGGIGDGSLIFFVLNDATGTAYVGTDIVFQGVIASDNRYTRQGILISNADNVSLTGGYATITGPLLAYASAGRLGPNVRIGIGSNVNTINGYTLPFAITSTTQITGVGWTLANGALDFLYFLPDGRIRVRYSADVTPDAPEVGLFDLTLTAGWANITDLSAIVLDNVTGDPAATIAVNAGAGPNKVTVGFKSATANLHKLTAYFTVGR